MPSEPPERDPIVERLQKLEGELASLRRESEPNLTSTLLSQAVIGTLVPAARNSEPIRVRFAALREFPLMLRMFFDARYQVSRFASLGAPLCLGLMVLDYFFFSFWSVPFLAPLLERGILVVLTITLYKLLLREVARYEEALDYLNRYGN